MKLQKNLEFIQIKREGSRNCLLAHKRVNSHETNVFHLLNARRQQMSIKEKDVTPTRLLKHNF